jgi:hypothetical protein
MAMTIENKDSIPGYVYLVDNGMDYKIGLTNNPVRRGSSYVTENPRNKVIDCIQVSTYREAEQVEQELVRKMRHLNSFTNSKEWQKRCPETRAIWNSVTSRYSGGSSVDHSKVYERTRELEREIEATKQKLRSANQAKAEAEKTYKAAEGFYDGLCFFFKFAGFCGIVLVIGAIVLGSAAAHERGRKQKLKLEAERVQAEAEAEVDRRLALANGHDFKVDGKYYFVKDGSVYPGNPNNTWSEIEYKKYKMPKPTLEFDLFWRCLDAQVLSKLPKTVAWNSSKHMTP